MLRGGVELNFAARATLLAALAVDAGRLVPAGEAHLAPEAPPQLVDELEAVL